MCNRAVFLAVSFLVCSVTYGHVFTDDSFISDTNFQYDGQDITVHGCTVTINGEHTFASLTIERDETAQPGVVTHQPGFSNASVTGMVLTIAGNLTIQTGSRLDLTGRGFPATAGPGGAPAVGNNHGAGGGYAGRGGRGTSGGGGPLPGGAVYGLVLAPNDLGSGGGSASTAVGGAGGGAIKVTVGGVAAIDGVLAANGVNGGGSVFRSGGGSGGSIWFVTTNLTGSGSITANGGDGGSTFGGGGAGGRIVLFSDVTTFGGTLQAIGGAGGAQAGGAGTIWKRLAAGSVPVLTINNAGQSGASTEPVVPQSFQGNFELGGGAVLSPITGTRLDWSFNGDVIVAADGAVSADVRGFGSATGPGRGASVGNAGAGGAGYGGNGGAGSQGAGGVAYGSRSDPNHLGSGGGNATSQVGGSGGGSIRLLVEGTLRVDGPISANGGNGNGNGSTTFPSGGGSGGTIWLSAGTLTGGSVIRANGGSAAQGLFSGGGGAGGRIAIFTCDQQIPVANITSNGGTALHAGQPGTVYFGSGSVELSQQPQDQTFIDGDNATASISVVASGNGPLTYQWRRQQNPAGDFANLVEGQDGGRVTGVQTPTLLILAFRCSDGGRFDCLVSDACGSYPSLPAHVTTLPRGDLNGDGLVGLDDLSTLLANFGDQSGATREHGDLTGDGAVTLDDLSTLLSTFGQMCP